MYRFRKHIAFLLVFALTLTALTTGCEDSQNGNDNFFTRLFGFLRASPPFTEQAKMPDRPYVAVSDDDPLESAKDFLSKESLGAEELLLTPQIEREILAAEFLDEVADSRLRTERLRLIGRELKVLAERMDADDEADDSLKKQIDLLSEKIDFLFSEGVLGILPIEPKTALMGTWDEPDRVILRWNPQMDWIPDEGYHLYRVLNGVTALLSENLGTKDSITALTPAGREFSEFIQPLYESSLASPEVLQRAGVATADEFNRLIAARVMPVANRYRFSGAQDFSLLKDRTFKVYSTLAGRIPDPDNSGGQWPKTVSDIKALPLSVSYMKVYGFSKLVPTGGLSPEDSITPDPGEDEDPVLQIFRSRNDFLTKSNIDLEFAQAAGFGYEDNLDGETVEEGALIEYILVPQKPEWKQYDLSVLSSGQRPEGAVSAKIPYGVKSPLETPSGLEGYGADDQVRLRWSVPEDSYAKSIISGFFIERKMKNEKEYTVLNDVPAAISYTDDDDGILYEMPVFYSDLNIRNGDVAKYRIRSLDIFGRLSDYSEELDITVNKVTPPGTPNLDQPVLSVSDLQKVDDHVKQAAAANEGKTGVILSITKATEDTDEFVVFRSEALGNASFGDPLEIARISANDLPEKDQTQPKIVKYRKVKLLLHPVSETGVSAVFFDQDIREGCYYKYWVAAADHVGNESAWSAGKIVGVPTNQLPVSPQNAQVEFKTNVLPELVLDIPGFAKDRMITDKNEDRTIRSEFATKAMEMNVRVGVSLSDVVRNDQIILPRLISKDFSNLPRPEDIHEVVALGNEDLLPDGNARVSWYHFSGEGLSGYHVYRAYADEAGMEELLAVPVPELMTAFSWSVVAQNVQQNTMTDSVEKKTGRIYLYLVFLVPEESENKDLPEEKPHLFEPGGWINLSWENPEDPQWGYFRVYRNEVAFFADDQDPRQFHWTLVGDHIRYNTYSEKADQTHAHYYYYKITSVSIWGVESTVGEVIRYRVASTSPPQTPSMLLPFAQKGKVKIAWVGVPFASKYTLYRTKLPKIKEEDVAGLELISPDLFTKVFTPITLNDTFLTDRLFIGIGGDLKPKPSVEPGAAITQMTALPLVSRFNTVQLQSRSVSIGKIGQVKTAEKIQIYKDIASKYGVLALSPYGQLDLEMAKLVLWDVVHEVEIPTGDPSEGVFDFVDESVIFGDTYLYTVRAENDDKLTSGRPDPVSVSPRKSAPFPPVTGLKGQISQSVGKPHLTWDIAKEPNLTWKESREFIAGYIVYKSKTKDGTYYQASELLTDAEFYDRQADVFAANWYKVKVVDTGGYLSDFSEPVSVQKAPNFLIPVSRIKPSPLIPKLSAESDTVNLSVLSPIITIAPITPFIPVQPIIPDTLTINGFVVTDLSAQTVTGGKGDATLRIGESYEVGVTVDIVKRVGTVITQGKAVLKDPVSFGDSGLYFNALTIDTAKPGALVSGYLKKEDGSNLIGDLYALTFGQAEMTVTGVIKVTAVPSFHYDHLLLRNISLATINLGGITQQIPSQENPGLVLIPPIVYGSSFLSIFGGKAENNLGMETLDNKGLMMEFAMMGFDEQGKLTGSMQQTQIQTIRTVIPAGLGIRVMKAVLVYENGVVNQTKSNISGKVLVPFETFQDSLPVELDPQLLIQTFSPKDVVVTDVKLHKKIIGTSVEGIAVNNNEKKIVDRGMYYLASRIQANSLKVLPMDASVQEKLSTVPFNVTQWSGRGFVVEDTTMTPALVGNAEEEIGVTPGKVGLDLSRTQAYQGDAPQEVGTDDWMGIVIKNGRVGLPPAYIKTDSDTRVLFTLTPGEMIYDRNGIFYQNQAYSAEGIPVNFGDSLGGFRDVIVNLIYLDIYNNKVNLEIQGEMGIPLFGYQRVKVRLYTSKELGKLVCSVAETEKFDPSGTGRVLLKVLGGHLRPDGLHMDGTIDLVFEDRIVSRDMQFTEMIIPADMEFMLRENNAELLYGRALFDQSYRIRFHDFEMDTRIITFDSVKKSFQIAALTPMLVNGVNRDLKLRGIVPVQAAAVSYYDTTLTLWGGMQLSDNLSMNNSDDFDRIAVGSVFTSPTISYEESKSRLDLNFEGFASVNAVVTPLANGDDGLVEYNTDSINMAFNSSNSLLDALPVQANVRLGYDKTMQRYFFAIAIYYHDPSGGIRFAYGTINDITGVIGYNLDLVYDSATGYQFPNSKDGFFHSVDELAVNRTPEGNYFFAATAWMYLGMDTGSGKIKLGEVRNIYLVVEKGPNVEMGGEFYGPASIQSIATGKNFTRMGSARIGYYHSERLFQFSISLYELGMYGCTVSGDLGFAMSPKFWEVRIGYPEMLTAKMGIMTGGFGFALRHSDYPHDSFIVAKMFFGYDTGDVSIWPVYFRAYLFAGGEGEYYFDSGNLLLYVFIEGGLEGGIKVAGKKYRIIHLMVGANGTLARSSGDWNLQAKVKVRYHLDLFLTSVSGSVTWHMSKNF